VAPTESPSAHDEEPIEPSLRIDRLLARSPIAPAWIGLGISLLLFGLFGVSTLWSGGYAIVTASGRAAWEYREFRLAVLVVTLAGYLPVARFHLTRSAVRNRRDLARWLGVDAPRASGRLDPRRSVRAGLIGLAILPITALIVDRDPGLYFRSGYWAFEQAFAWVVGGFVTFWAGSFAYATLAWSQHFSRLAASLREIDLLDPGGEAPFARQGLTSALLWLVLLSLMALNVIDLAWFIAIAVFALVVGVAALLLPVQGVRSRIRQAKRQELDRITAALRGDGTALADSPIRARAAGLSVADLLAYRHFVESVREWPFDTVTIVRFGLYLAIPLGSWLGGALVERLLGAALD